MKTITLQCFTEHLIEEYRKLITKKAEELNFSLEADQYIREDNIIIQSALIRSIKDLTEKSK